MEKKYQIFISSTYEDLKEARQETVQAVLDLDHFPVGMEYFPAANKTQWEYITNLIEQCDYYIVIVAGRYGSQDENGVSYTQKEFEYAVNKGVPTIAFIHSDVGSLPSSRVDSKKDIVKKLGEFRKELQAKLCKEWKTKEDLHSSIIAALVKLFKTDPRPGWVRADSIAGIEATTEIIKLRNKIDELNLQIQQFKIDQDSALENLAQGDDEIEFNYKATYYNTDYPTGHQHRTIISSRIYTTTWDKIFSSFAFDLKSPVQEKKIKSDIELLIRHDTIESTYSEDGELYTLNSVTIERKTVYMVLNQLLALEYINVETIEHERRLIKLYSLTPKGDKFLLHSCAIKKGAAHND